MIILYTILYWSFAIAIGISIGGMSGLYKTDKLNKQMHDVVTCLNILGWLLFIFLIIMKWI